ncbi:hypothetical protein BVRB_6g140520 isoform A [Beta vulgaris subsp. vulgaris]|uniref:F-box/FBD/LRR-repeat protein At1g13570 isoform X2 n=1 Tax=Beta vulgaris subsp. vulgaris TaxID=3555 RepID=UPI00054028A2|nr:F-box/FBD/LRR-repeat protein At1g13570 isoform X2 [Beta vulgaris subsp. vulgaris]KMT08372.1 hypothetical protein BVRB_6g140520 isoform A [Beta vulgaris subsp. vulgaris]
MNHKKSKIRHNDSSLDMISNLPTDVIYKLLERFSLKDAARMSVLSHKWRDIWTSNPHLVFDEPFFARVLKQEVRDTDKFCNVVSNILFQHEGPILKFSLAMPLQLGSRLFSCVDLENLKLTCCIFSLPPDFRGFPKLISLELDAVVINYTTFKNLIGNCPVLQKIVLTNFTGLQHRHVIIEAPNLRYLTLDWAFKSVYVTCCENLVSASIGLPKLVKVHNKASLGDLVKVLTNSSKLERLCLRSHLCRILFTECNLRTASQKLRNLDLLDLHLDFQDDVFSVFSCIQSFPNIETLKISVHSSSNLAEHVLDYNADGTLHNLRCAKVRLLVASTTEMKLIEFLLACSPVLEKLLVHAPAVMGSSRLKMLLQLNRFRRISQKVEVICPVSEVITSASSSDSPSAESAYDSSDSD